MKTRLLIADDHQDHQSLLMLALASSAPDLEVHLANSGDEFLHLVRHEHFDCVVLDYHLGDDHADDLIQRAGADLIGTPVIVVSSCREQAVAIASFRSKNVSDFVPKEQAVVGEALWNAIRIAVEAGRTMDADRRKARRRERELVRLSETDALTGLMNRRGLQRVLELSRGRKDARVNAACILIDIDHFKQINDMLGHEAGDCALKRLAELLKLFAAPTDRVVRWGGEEFLVLRSSNDVSSAWSWTERLRRTVEATPICVGDRQIRLTISAGVCVVPTPHMGMETIALADQAMYLAKSDGRNRVCTGDMVRVRAIAEHIGTEPHQSVEERRRRFIAAASPMLGLGQLAEITKHCEAVTGLARLIARRLSDSEVFIDHVGQAALLHDIGKSAVPDGLITKPSSLNPDERWLMDAHAEHGAAIAEALGACPEVVAGVAEHHRWHSRTPEVLAGQRVPGVRVAEIVAAADALVAMTSTRPYRAAISIPEAVERLLDAAGHQFEPSAVGAMVKLASSTLAA